MSLLGDLAAAICDHLRDDNAVVRALGSSNVFDIAPRAKPGETASSVPMIYVGAMGGQSEEQCGALLRFNARVRLYVVTDEGDRQKAHDIAQAVMVSLHGQILTLPRLQQMENLVVENVGDIVDSLDAQMVFVDLRSLCKISERL